jgi:hypothetical protein
MSKVRIFINVLYAVSYTLQAKYTNYIKIYLLNFA